MRPDRCAIASHSTAALSTTATPLAQSKSPIGAPAAESDLASAGGAAAPANAAASANATTKCAGRKADIHVRRTTRLLIPASWAVGPELDPVPGITGRTGNQSL